MGPKKDNDSSKVNCFWGYDLWKSKAIAWWPGKKYPGTSGDTDVFKASRGWFEKFKKRSGVHSVVRHGEAASANQKAAEEFVQDFSDYVKANGFIPQQVFNCDETSLFWKKNAKDTNQWRTDWLFCYVEMQVQTSRSSHYSCTTRRIRGYLKKHCDKK